jgi:hypothetical protein
MANNSRELKAVALVIALLALPVIALAFHFATWDARAVCLYVGASILLIGAGVGLYAYRPALFGASGVVGDPLRTQYRTPAPVVRVAPVGAVPLSNAQRLFPVSEHVYAWQSVRRVAAGEPVWTPAYRRLVLAQTAALVGAIALNLLLAIGVTFALAACAGAVFFLAAAAVLAVCFPLGLVSVIIDGEQHPKVPMAALPDTTPWVPVIVPAVQKTAVVTTPPATQQHAA